MSSEEPSHLSAYALDVLESGGLSPAEEQRARAHLAACVDCTRRLEQAHSSAEHFKSVVKPRTLEQLRQRMIRKRKRSLLERPGVVRGLWIAGVLGVAVVVALLLWR